MKAIICKEFATVDDLCWEEVSDPVAGDNEVVIDIGAAGLNYPDNLIVRGLYQFRPDLPFSPGHEGAGTVSAVGKNVFSLRVGDRVAFFKGFGAFAEFGDGLEGLIHVSQLSSKNIIAPEEAVKVDDNIKAKVIKVDTNDKKIALSIKAYEENLDLSQIEKEQVDMEVFKEE